MKIFYSWQSDIKKNKSYVNACLEEAVKTVSGFEIETATRNSKGSVDIASNILNKIKESDLFIADISIINNDDASKRKCPNPNVMYELGYAVHALGEENIILVANKLTTETSLLPFDIRNRRIIIHDFSTEKKRDLITLFSKIMAEYHSQEKEEQSPKVTLTNGELKWASNWSGYGASFRTEIDIDNYKREQDYITEAKIIGQNNLGNPWETSIFTFEGLNDNKPFHIEEGKIVHAVIFLTDEKATGRAMPKFDMDMMKLVLKFRSGELISLNYKPSGVKQA